MSTTADTKLEYATWHQQNVIYRELRGLACETLVSLRDQNEELGFLNPTPHDGKLLFTVRAVATVSVVAGLAYFLAGKISG